MDEDDPLGFCKGVLFALAAMAFAAFAVWVVLYIVAEILDTVFA